MSYLNQAQDPRRRAAALTGTLAIQAALAFAVVTGLTFSADGPIRDVWDPFTITPERNPPPPPPEPQKQQSSPETTIGAPQTPIDLRTDDPPVVVIDDTTIYEFPSDPLPPVARPDPPRPIASFIPRAAKPSNSPQRWVTTDDYPGGPLRSEIEGTAGYRVVVGTNGRVSSCEITRPSGNGQLDGATCRYISQRARFDPATNETGDKVVGTYSGTVRWEIPD